MMTPKDFKAQWITGELDSWAEFDRDQLDKSSINSATKQFLSLGFPEDAAPFLGFDWRSNDWKFSNVNEYFGIDDPSKSHYWVFGSDGSGNPICFDTNDKDKIVMLDHEQDFDVFMAMNNSIQELALCLLAYKGFLNRMLIENGEDAIMDSNFTKDQVNSLEAEFKAINPNIIKESVFWRAELRDLYSECG